MVSNNVSTYNACRSSGVSLSLICGETGGGRGEGGERKEGLG